VSSVASLRRERIFVCVHSIPAAEKARCASTDVGGGLTANKSTRAVNAATYTAVSDFLPYFY